ncbi:MAG: DUF6036 family nucleotidyltransferase [Acidimicrobiales bacterium]
MLFQLEALEEALRTLGAVLQQRRTPYSLLIVGGSGLLLLRLIDRPTGDLDVVGMSDNGRYVKVESLPEPLADAALQVAQALELSEDWLNTGPASLMDFGLPQGWETRIEVRQYGGLEIHIPSRFDQICFKLYAAVDRGPDDKHFKDLQLLNPSADELTTAAHWTVTHDPSEGFRKELLGCLGSMGVEMTDADF